MNKEEFKQQFSQQTYLGGGVHASFDGFNIILITHNGIQMTNEIVLEPEVLGKLFKYRNEILETAKTIGA